MSIIVVSWKTDGQTDRDDISFYDYTVNPVFDYTGN